MSSIVISGDSSGTVSLTVPSVAGTNTATLPAATGTVMVSGNMPAFSAYLASAQSVNQNTYTKCLFDTELFDTNNNFASSRFTPTVAGYYQVNLNVVSDYNTTNSAGGIITAIYKNGSVYLITQVGIGTAGYAYGGYTASAVIYMNGTTDYLEGYGRNPNPTASAIFAGGSSNSTFSAALIRSA
jgi:hypothetical protein